MAQHAGGHGDDGGAGPALALFARPDFPGGVQAVHAGHVDVHQDGRPGAAFPGLDGRGPAVDGDDLDPERLQQGADHQPVGGVVVHRQHPHDVVETGRSLGLEHRRRRLGAGQGSGEAEAGALSHGAGEADLAAHQGQDLAADGEAQARAAEPPGGGGVGLDELVEQLRRALGGDAHAGVGDADLQQVALGVDPRRHRAGLGELQRVGEQVGDHLPQAHLVPAPPAPGLRRDLQAEGQAALLGEAAIEGREVLGEARHIEDRRRQLQPARLDLGDVQHVVDDPQQGAAGILDGGQARPLMPGEGIGGHGLGHAQHPVQGGAQLVAHGGQELGLAAAGGVGGSGQILGLDAQGLVGGQLLLDLAVQGLGGQARAQFADHHAAGHGRQADGPEGPGQADEGVLARRARPGLAGEQHQPGEGGDHTGDQDADARPHRGEAQGHDHEIDQLRGFEMEGEIGHDIGQDQEVGAQGRLLQPPPRGRRIAQQAVEAEAGGGRDRRQAHQDRQRRALLVEGMARRDDEIVDPRRDQVSAHHRSVDGRQFLRRQRLGGS